VEERVGGEHPSDNARLNEKPRNLKRSRDTDQQLAQKERDDNRALLLKTLANHEEMVLQEVKILMEKQARKNSKAHDRLEMMLLAPCGQKSQASGRAATFGLK
jgi:hypothetical protein